MQKSHSHRMPLKATRWSFSAAMLILLLLQASSLAAASGLKADFDPGSIAAATPLVIMPFQNETNDDSQDWLSYGLIERVPFEFLHAFDSQTDLDRIPASEMKGLTQDQLLEHVRKHASKGYIWWGAYTVHNGLLKVSVRIIEIESGKLIALGEEGKMAGTLEEISRNLPFFALQILRHPLNTPIDETEELKFSEVRAVPPEAWKSFSQAYGYTRDFEEGLSEQEGSFDSTEETNKALELLERTTRDYPEYDHAWDLLGWLTMGKGDVQLARRHFEKALGLAPDDIDALAGLGVSHLHDGRFSESLGWFNRILQINPSLSLYRLYLFAGLLYSNQTSRVIAAADDLAQSGFIEERKTAMEFAGDISDPDAIPILLRGLKDPAEEVRIQAITSLGLFNDPRAIDALFPLIKAQELDIRVAAIQALSQVGDSRILHVLESNLKDPEKEIRVAVVNAFERANSSIAVPVLLSALKDEDQEVREAAFQILAYERDSRVRAVVKTALMDDDPLIRTIAAESLAEDGDPGVRAQLALAVRDPDPEVRKAAVQSLANSVSDGELSLFMEAMADSDPGVRETAARGVQEVQTSDAQALSQLIPSLVQALKDDTPEVRAAALDSLSVIDDARALQAIRKASSDPDEQVRTNAIWALSAIADPSDLVFIQSGLNDRAADVRSATAQAMASSSDPGEVHSLLGTPAISDLELRKIVVRSLSDSPTASDNPEVVRYLAAALNDPDGEIRRNALSGLERIKYPEVDSAIRDALKDPDKQVQRTAMELYLQSENCCDTAFLLKTLESEHDDEYISWAVIEGLGRSKEPEVVPRLLLLLSDDSESVRLASLRALAPRDDRRIVPALVRLLTEDPASSVRAEAAGELANHEEAGVAIALAQSILYERDREVRVAAAQALGQAGNRSSVPVLLSLLNDADVGMRTTAIDALAQIGDNRAVPELVKIVESGDERLREAAVIALGEMKSREATPALSRLLTDNDLSLREAAVNALGAIGDAQAVDGLLDSLRDEDQSVCLAAIQALAGIEDPRKIPALHEATESLNHLVAAAAKEALEPPTESMVESGE